VSREPPLSHAEADGDSGPRGLDTPKLAPAPPVPPGLGPALLPNLHCVGSLTGDGTPPPPPPATSPLLVALVVLVLVLVLLMLLMLLVFVLSTPAVLATPV